MMHRATLTGALTAAFIFAFSSTASIALAAPAKAPARVAPKAMSVDKPAPKAEPAPMSEPAPKTEPAPMGTASAGNKAPAPKADPAPPAAGGAPVDLKPEFGDRGHRVETRVRGDHHLTSILVPIAFFLTILLLVGAIQYMGMRKDRNKHQTLRLMVEKGAQIPAELITPQKKPRGSDLRRGLVWVGAGLGITLFLLLTKDARGSGAFGLGLIPTLIGGGYLLAWKLEGKKSSAPPAAPTVYTNAELATTRPDAPSPSPDAE